MRQSRRIFFILRFVLLAIWSLLGITAASGALNPRAAAIKMTAPAWDANLHNAGVLWVKFHDDLPVRLRDTRLSDLGTGALATARPALEQLAEGTWSRESELSEVRLDELRRNAQRNLGKVTADLNTQFYFRLGPGHEPQAVLNLLNSVAQVEIALPVPLPVAPPIPPNFQDQQQYLNQPPEGIGALAAWGSLGVTGEGVRIADVESSWNDTHIDLPPVTLIGPQLLDGLDEHHGTAVLGVMASISNGWGTTGIAHGATYYFSGVESSGLPAAILHTLDILGPGDIILIEQQTFGPTGVEGYVPVEWQFFNYNAIVTAVGQGITVVEAAGNGGQDLDAPIYSQGHGGHWPFLPENDSGAIIVGAGASPGGSDVARSRLNFSTFGSTVDLQGYGEWVMTTGFGGSYTGSGIDEFYTVFFGGTSSATAIVAGACALLQSAYETETGMTLTPAQVRDVLRSSGSPQQIGNFPLSENIGPLPDVPAAVAALDCDGNGLFDAMEVATGIGSDCNGNQQLDACEVPIVHLESGAMSPLGDVTHSYVVSEPPLATGDVLLRFKAAGDLYGSAEYVNVWFNGRFLTTIFVFETGSSCPENPFQDETTLAKDLWNSAVEAGPIEIQLVPEHTINPTACPSSYIAVEIDYPNSLLNDCNDNGVPDTCEVSIVHHESMHLGPLGAGIVQAFVLNPSLPAASNVTLTFEAYGDLGFSSENVAVDINGLPVGVLWASVGSGHDCPTTPDVATLVVSASTWNLATASGSAAIHMVPSAGVLATQCPVVTYIAVEVEYAAEAPLDLDGDGSIDSCRPSTASADLNNDGVVNGMDLAILLGAWGRCPPRDGCDADLDGNGAVNGLDLAMLLGAWS